MLKKIVILFILLVGSYPAYALIYQQAEDPKSYVTRLRFNYNFNYERLEIETKISSHLKFGSVANWNFGFLGSITMFIHPTDGFFGTYPVDNLIGFVGFYAEVSNFIVPNLDVTFYPLVHESTHLVDGYDRGDVDDDRVFDSNEYLGFDLAYRFSKNFRFFTGLIMYIYFPSKPLDSVTRPIITRFHIGEDWRIPLSEKINLLISSDFAIFYENRFHPAVNLGVGVDFGPCNLMLHYETQYGLGQDYKELQRRFGVELIIY